MVPLADKSVSLLGPFDLVASAPYGSAVTTRQSTRQWVPTALWQQLCSICASRGILLPSISAQPVIRSRWTKKKSESDPPKLCNFRQLCSLTEDFHQLLVTTFSFCFVAACVTDQQLFLESFRAVQEFWVTSEYLPLADISLAGTPVILPYGSRSLRPAFRSLFGQPVYQFPVLVRVSLPCHFSGCRSGHSPMHCVPFSLYSPLSLVVPATDFLLPWFPALAILDGNTGFFQARLSLGPTTAIPFLVGFLFGFSSLGSPSAVPDREGVHPKPSSNPSAPQPLSYLNPSL